MEGRGGEGLASLRIISAANHSKCSKDISTMYNLSQNDISTTNSFAIKLFWSNMYESTVCCCSTYTCMSLLCAAVVHTHV